MIRRATAYDNTKIMNYLMSEPSMNSNITGNIESFGYDTEFLDVWIETGDQDEIKAVLMRYDGSYIPYSKGDFDVLGFAEIIKESHPVQVFSGKDWVTEKFEKAPGLYIGTNRQKYLCELKDKEHLHAVDSCVKRATVDDVDRLVELRSKVKEFGNMGSYAKSLKRSLETKSARTFFVEQDGKIVACSNTSPESSASVMIVAVCTDPDYRGKGYASLCMNALCSELLDEGKTLCLFYDNPLAAKIYKKLGFKDIDLWNRYTK